MERKIGVEPTLTTYTAQCRVNLASSLLKKRPDLKTIEVNCLQTTEYAQSDQG